MKSQIVSSYLRNHRLPTSMRGVAEMIYDDLLVLLDYIHANDVNFTFTSELQPVDDMWHTLILHTRLYEKYCSDSFGCFMHHEPAQESVSSAPSGETSGRIADQTRALENSLGLNYVRRLYFVYPALFSQGISDAN